MRVLIVEDERDMADLFARALRCAGHDVMMAPDGREALALVMGATPDLVLLDLRLPHLDGISLLGIIRSYLRLVDLPVFVVTATSEAEVERAHDYDVQRIFRKGQFALDDLLTAVSEVGAVS